MVFVRFHLKFPSGAWIFFLQEKPNFLGPSSLEPLKRFQNSVFLRRPSKTIDFGSVQYERK
jgi:hypothetical protein